MTPSRLYVATLYGTKFRSYFVMRANDTRADDVFAIYRRNPDGSCERVSLPPSEPRARRAEA